MERMANALPSKFTKRNTTKHVLANMLVDIFFVLVDVIASTSFVLPSCSLSLGRALDKLMTDIVCVRNYYTHELSNNAVKSRVLQSEPVIGT